MTTAVTRRELLAWALAIALAITAVTFARPGGVDAGSPATQTDTVYLATGENFPDALALSVLAGLGLGPVLLVQHNQIPQATLDELGRLMPVRIVISGGTAVISEAVQTHLEELFWEPEVVRIAGANRYETAAELSAAIFPTTGLYPRGMSATSANPIVGPVPPGDLLDATIEVPAPGFLVISASSWHTAKGPNVPVSCWITVNEEKITGTDRFIHLDAGGPIDGICTTHAYVDVQEGLHTVALRANSDNTDVNDRTLTIIWVPFEGRPTGGP